MDCVLPLLGRGSSTPPSYAIHTLCGSSIPALSLHGHCPCREMGCGSCIPPNDGDIDTARVRHHCGKARTVCSLQETRCAALPPAEVPQIADGTAHSLRTIGFAAMLAGEELHTCKKDCRRRSRASASAGPERGASARAGPEREAGLYGRGSLREAAGGDYVAPRLRRHGGGG